MIEDFADPLLFEEIPSLKKQRVFSLLLDVNDGFYNLLIQADSDRRHPSAEAVTST
jgi:hypothetical protein